jgi:hypothetical protein
MAFSNRQRRAHRIGDLRAVLGRNLEQTHP